MSSNSGFLPHDVVLSDVHLYYPYTCSKKENFVLSRFFFTHSHLAKSVVNSAKCDKQYSKSNQEEEQDQKFPTEDEDGDLVVERLRNNEVEKDVITIEHSLATPVSSVGTQVWRGSLLLCDYLVHHEAEFEGIVALELGGGVGLCSIVMARVAKRVFCTDIAEILFVCEENRKRNQDLFKNYSKDNDVMIVKELDFFNPLLVLDHSGAANHWTNTERDELKKISVIIASDVIYDNLLTDAFLDTTVQLLSLNPSAVLYVSLEKRVNFTLSALQVASPAYDYFRSKLTEMTTRDGPLDAKRLPTNFPQYFEYDRVKELELWEIRKKKNYQ